MLFSLDSSEKLCVNLALSNDLSVLVHVFNLKIDLWHLAFDYLNTGVLTFTVYIIIDKNIAIPMTAHQF